MGWEVCEGGGAVVEGPGKGDNDDHVRSKFSGTVTTRKLLVRVFVMMPLSVTVAVPAKQCKPELGGQSLVNG